MKTCFFLLPVFLTLKCLGGESLVPSDEYISDYHARFILAQLIGQDEERQEEALKHYFILFEERPDDLNLRSAIAKIYFDLGKEKEARNIILFQEEFFIYVVEEPVSVVDKIFLKDDKATLKRARELRCMGLQKRALSIYQYLLKRSKKGDSKILSKIGDTYVELHENRKALIYYRQAFEMDPQSEDIKKKYALSLAWDLQYRKALPLLGEIFEIDPSDKEAGLQLSVCYYDLDEQKKAKEVLEELLHFYPNDVAVLFEEINVDLSLGHVKKARDDYADLFENIDDVREDLFLRYASKMMSWGDFYGAEKIYLEYLRKYPSDYNVQLQLAWLYGSSKRYEEADGLYQNILIYSDKEEEAYFGLCRLKILEKDYKEALRYADLLLKFDRDSAYLMKAKALFLSKRYDEAFFFYEKLQRTNKYQKEALVNLGRILLKKDAPEKAKFYFEKAMERYPKEVDAYFYLSYPSLKDEQFLFDLITSKRWSVKQLDKWAQLYGADGFRSEAIFLYNAILQFDPDYFPAQLYLPVMLGLEHKYCESVRLFENLAKDYDKNYLVLLWKARIAGWGRYFDDSLSTYGRMQSLNPNDPLPRREMARVAFWAKKMDLAIMEYRSFSVPSVDEKLFLSLQPFYYKLKTSLFKEDFVFLEQKVEGGSLYEGYERIYEKYKSGTYLPDKDLDHLLQKKIYEFFSLYLIQKSFSLEEEAENYCWHERFAKAKEVYKKLISFTPGQEETLFDYAQVNCELGFCDESKKYYQRLLEIEPQHMRAQIALEKNEIISHPYVMPYYWYWRDKGRGEIEQLAQHILYLKVGIPIMCKNEISISAIRWFEKPFFTGDVSLADGFSVDFFVRATDYISAQGGFSSKFYHEDFKDRHSGYFNVTFSLSDLIYLTLGYNKEDQLDNFFSFRKGIQVDKIWGRARFNFTRYTKANLELRNWVYNDNNNLQYHNLSLEHLFTNHPKIFKVTLWGEFRDTRKLNVFIFNNTGFLLDIVHPYWTPRDYFAGFILFEWFHEFSKEIYCGNEKHFYDLKLSTGYDTEKNPMIAVDGRISMDFKKHWNIDLNGYLHRSKLWDADRICLKIKYHF